MHCPKPGCNGQMFMQPIDEQTARKVCGSCGYSQIVETKGGNTTGRRLLTDEMPAPGGPLNG